MTSSVFWGLLLVAAVTNIAEGDVTLSCDAKVTGCNAEGGAASTYVRWGSSACPAGAELVYSGEVGGGKFSKSGAAANMLCLPLDPSYPDHDNNTVHVAEIYHVEYSIAPDTRNDRHVVCAVCRVPRATSVMIPSSVRCPSVPGWHAEYRGYLMSGLPWDGRSSVEFLCVDLSLGGESRTSAVGSNYGILYHTRTQCHAALPCPNFQEKITGCVVCSK